MVLNYIIWKILIQISGNILSRKHYMFKLMSPIPKFLDENEQPYSPVSSS